MFTYLGPNHFSVLGVPRLVFTNEVETVRGFVSYLRHRMWACGLTFLSYSIFTFPLV